MIICALPCTSSMGSTPPDICQEGAMGTVLCRGPGVHMTWPGCSPGWDLTLMGLSWKCCQSWVDVGVGAPTKSTSTNTCQSTTEASSPNCSRRDATPRLSSSPQAVPKSPAMASLVFANARRPWTMTNVLTPAMMLHRGQHWSLGFCLTASPWFPLPALSALL